MTLNTILKNYQQIDPYKPQDRDFFKQLLEGHPVEVIISETISILKQGGDDSYAVLSFLRKAVLFRAYDPQFKPIATAFRNEIPKTKIFTTLEILIYSSDAGIRDDAIYTLGKMCFKEGISILQNAIPIFTEKYPEQLERLHFELTWLKKIKPLNKL